MCACMNVWLQASLLVLLGWVNVGVHGLVHVIHGITHIK